MSAYIPRIIDELIKSRLRAVGGIVIEGSRAVGKTQTGLHHAASNIRLDRELERQPKLAEDLNIILRGETPRLIDEWQTLPSIWNVIRHEIDDRGQAGQFILTGSAIPRDNVTRHSGAGRFSRLRMRPLTLMESGHSSGSVSLHALLHTQSSIQGNSTNDTESIIQIIIRGGWPGLVQWTNEDAGQWVADYVNELTFMDLSVMFSNERSRDPRKVARVFRSIARMISGSPSVASISRDIEGDEQPLTRDTVYDYLDSLRRVMILEEIPAWQPHIRSRTALRQKHKMYFADPSIGPAALGVSATALLQNLNYVGQLFENLVVRDMLVYAQANNAKLSYYRDDNGLEVDIIVEGEDTAWMAMEIKLGQTYIEDAAKSLLKLRAKVDTEKMGEPNSLVIITSSGYAYTRKDGVHVIPIDLFKP